MVIFGVSAFSWLLKSQLRYETGIPPALLRWSVVVALVTNVLSLGFVANEMMGTGTAGLNPTIVWQVARETLYGQLALVRASLLATLLAGTWLRRSWMFPAGVILGGGALALLGLTSHAAAAVAQQYEYVFAAGDALHLLAGGFWIGGLVALIPSVLAQPRDYAKLVALLQLFSRWAAAAVAILVLAGTASAIAILDMQGMRWSSAYLTWLAIKLVLAGVMIALALTNRFGIMPALTRGEKEAADTLPLTVFAELGCAALIVLVVGILGLTAPMQM
jgi:putative copper resistance protein D